MTARSCNHSSARRRWLAAAASLPLVPGPIWAAAAGAGTNRFSAQLQEIEQQSGGRLGLACIDTGSGDKWGHRADERFPMCSTFKVMLAAAVQVQGLREPGLMLERISFISEDIVPHAPVTREHVDDSMVVSDLCAAAIQYSDNTAANLLIKRLGGPQAVTAFARSIGDTQFRLDRWETALNSAEPGDPRDTSTPAAMALSLQRLALGTALPPAQCVQLISWLRGSTTGRERLRAGLPVDWEMGDKTGSGNFGTTNDLALLWPPGRAPLVVAAYFTQPARDAKLREDVLASVGRLLSQGSGA